MWIDLSLHHRKANSLNLPLLLFKTILKNFFIEFIGIPHFFLETDFSSLDNGPITFGHVTHVSIFTCGFLWTFYKVL